MNKELKNITERYERFVDDINFRFYFMGLSFITFMIAMFSSTYGTFLFASLLCSFCIGISIAHMFVMVIRVYGRIKWKK